LAFILCPRTTSGRKNGGKIVILHPEKVREKMRIKNFQKLLRKASLQFSKKKKKKVASITSFS
jgi:hypothetical protein